MSVWRRSILWLSVVISVASQAARADPPISFIYAERPPFTETRPDGSVGGIVGKPVFAAVQAAGIPAEWAATPAARQLEIIRQNDSRSCAFGWFKTAERQGFARFTKAISQDSPTIALANPGFEPPPDITLDALLDDPNLDVVVKESLVYGNALDGKLAAMKARRQTTAREFGDLIRMIHDGHGLTFLPLEEVIYYEQQAGLPADGFTIITFRDMPPGEKRYIMCSMQVEPGIIDRLNAQIHFE